MCALSTIWGLVSASTRAAQRVLEVPLSFASDTAEAKDASTWAAQTVLKVSFASDTVEVEDAL